MHDKFLSCVREKKKLGQNTVCKTVKHVKAFLRYVREDRGCRWPWNRGR